MATKAILGEPMFRGNSDAIISGRMSDDVLAAINSGDLIAGMAVGVSQESNKTTIELLAADGSNFAGFLNGADINLCANTAGVISHGLSVVALNTGAAPAAKGKPVGVDARGLICDGTAAVITLNGAFVGDVGETFDNLSNGTTRGAGARINFTGFTMGAPTRSAGAPVAADEPTEETAPKKAATRRRS